MTRCPECGFEVPDGDLHAEIAHMNAEHPDVIAQRLRAAGIEPDDLAQFGEPPLSDLEQRAMDEAIGAEVRRRNIANEGPNLNHRYWAEIGWLAARDYYRQYPPKA